MGWPRAPMARLIPRGGGGWERRGSNAGTAGGAAEAFRAAETRPPWDQRDALEEPSGAFLPVAALKPHHPAEPAHLPACDVVVGV